MPPAERVLFSCKLCNVTLASAIDDASRSSNCSTLASLSRLLSGHVEWHTHVVSYFV